MIFLGSCLMTDRLLLPAEPEPGTWLSDCRVKHTLTQAKEGQRLAKRST